MLAIEPQINAIQDFISSAPACSTERFCVLSMLETPKPAENFYEFI